MKYNIGLTRFSLFLHWFWDSLQKSDLKPPSSHGLNLWTVWYTLSLIVLKEPVKSRVVWPICGAVLISARPGVVDLWDSAPSVLLLFASFHLAANRKMSVVLPLYTRDYIDEVGLALSPTCAHSAAGNFGLTVQRLKLNPFLRVHDFKWEKNH